MARRRGHHERSVGMVVETALGAITAVQATTWAVKKTKDWVKGRDPTADMAEAAKEYREELEPLIEQRLCNLEDSNENRRRLDELLGTELLFILQNYDIENRREATRKRRIMLAHAAAGSLRLDLTIAEIARVERVIRELDPDDVGVLAQLDRQKDPGMAPVPADKQHVKGELRDEWRRQVAKVAHNRYRYWMSVRPKGEILLPAGCVIIEQSAPIVTVGESTGIYLTALGGNVLQVLETYIRTEGLDQ